MRWLLTLALLGMGQSTLAESPVDVYEFPNAEMEARYRALIDEFRCPRCLNTNLAGSDAPIAEDLRAAVHRLLVQAGWSDAEIRDYLRARYGDFVLYDPPVSPATWLLWGGPGLLAGIGLLVLLRRLRYQRAPRLDASERARLKQLLESRTD